MPIINGYQIEEEICRSTKSVLYRAKRIKDDHIVLLRLSPVEYPGPSDLSRLHHEYEMTKSLAITGIVKPFALEEYDKGVMLVYENTAGISLGNRLTGSMEIKVFLEVAISLSQIVHELHQAHIIHKDINPHNILIDPDTNAIKLTGLGIASILPRENPSIANPGIIEGTLPYISPEQTGRMNRSIDYRSDFYSMGASFYEMLCGTPPFPGSDPGSLVHCHMAKAPVPPAQMNPAIPGIVSDIIIRLLAKTPEERYQSASGLKSDMEKCLTQIRTQGGIDRFVLQQDDIVETFNIPQKLYGRQREIDILLHTFEQVSEGKTKVMMVSGYAGVGKTSLIQEIYKFILLKGGYFISGKFDQFHCNEPYSALVHTFQDLVRQLLTENEAALGQWREKLNLALGPNGQIIIDVIPEVEMVIGPQPAVLNMGPVEAQNRFNRVFQEFIKVFCKPEHPLVIFLDDLHWIDVATLKLIEQVISNRQAGYLFLIGAFRSNKIPLNHPLHNVMDHLRDHGEYMSELKLAPLNREQTADLLADTLHCDPASTLPLAELVERKTAGNPFFMKQFLQTLYEKKLFEFNVASRCWHWELSRIQNSEMTDNVVDLMVGKIRQMPRETQSVLKMAACIGNRFDLKTLAIVNGKPANQTIQDLWPAIKEDLIFSTSDLEVAATVFETDVLNAMLKTEQGNPILRFKHDRVQQAAYLLIQGKQKKIVHLKIGRLISESLESGELNEKIFSVVHHLNYASELITDEQERKNLARLNLTAGIKAKSSAAYEPALKYLEAGVSLLNEQSWQDHYELTFNLHKHMAEAQYLNQSFEKSEQLAALVLTRAGTDIEKAEVYRMLIVQYTLRANYVEAYAVGRKALWLLGIRIPEKGQTDIRPMLDKHVAQIMEKIGSRPIASLVEAPGLTVPDKIIAAKLLSDMLPLGFFLDLNLFSYLTITLVELSLQYGYVPDCSYGFACFGRLLITRGEYKRGYEFGLLGMQLSEKFNDLGQKCRCHNSFANFVMLWQRHIRWTNTLNTEAYQAGLQSGEFQFAGYSVCNILFNLFYEGHNLEKILSLCAQYEPFVLTTRNHIARGGIAVVRWTLLNLIHPPEGEFGSIDTAFKLDTHFKKKQYIKSNFMVACHYQTYIAQLFYHYGKPEQALPHIQNAAETLDYVAGSVITAKHNFYYSLILSALCDTANADTRNTYRKQLVQNQQQMEIWSNICEANFLHKYLLIAAETARISNNDCDATILYDRAVETAQKNGFIHDEALANELAAKFWLQKGHEAFATTYMRKAVYAYRIWGADGKVQHLKKSYAAVLNGTDSDKPAKGETSSDIIDLATFIKASQAITSEIVLDKLLTKLTWILIENAGAQRGLLILKSGDDLFIEADGDIDKETVAVLQSLPLEQGQNISPRIIKYVARTLEYLVLNNTSEEGLFAAAPHAVKSDAKSIVCGPILHKSKLVGIFYLENRLISSAFTPDRVEILKLLAASMAISIENARLYTNLESQAEKIKTANLRLNQQIIERKRAEEKYRSIFENALEGIFQVTPNGRFISANPALARIFGFDSPESLIQSITDIGQQLYVDPDQRDVLYRLLEEQQKSISDFEAEMYRKNGSTMWASIHARPVFDEKGTFMFLEGILTDISENKRQAEAQREREESLRKENIRLRSSVRDRYKFGSIVGKSMPMQGVYDLILKAAASEVNVIIYGESGTGKELVARAIHDMSERKGNPFIAVNCGAIPETLMESEFFGYKKGAFTGAYRDKHGYLEEADSGSLFLDELGEISLNMQVKLLRVLEGHGYTPVGDSKEKRANIRIIAATHRILQDHVKKGLLREDFFYRIHIIPIYLPPLRERKEDISLLIDHFQQKFDPDKKQPSIPGRVLEAMLDYEWPGNIRELQNTLQRYLMLGKLDFLNTPPQIPGNTPALSPERAGEDYHGLQDAMARFEKQYLLESLEQNRWQRDLTASSLGVNRKTLFRKIKAHNIDVPHAGHIWHLKQ